MTKIAKWLRRDLLANLTAVVVIVVWIFPVYWMVNTSFKDRQHILTNPPEFWPNKPTLENFGVALTMTNFTTTLVNSLVVVTATVAVSIGLGIFAAAAVSQFRFTGRRALLVMILVVQMVPGSALLIPLFFVFNTVGLLDTYAGLILAYVASVLPFSIWVMRGFFLAIPKELEEAARIDGASTWQTLTKVLFPLAAPGVIATSIFAFIAAWNDYVIAYTFMQTQDRYTLPVWLASFTTPEQGTNFGAQMAAATLFSAPVVIFFLIVQRKLVSGMSAGAVKG